MRSQLTVQRCALLGLLLFTGGVLGWLLLAKQDGPRPGRAHAASTSSGIPPVSSSGEAMSDVEESAAAALDDTAESRMEVPPTASVVVKVTRKKFAVAGRRVTVSQVGAGPEMVEPLAEAKTNRSGVVRFQLEPDRSYQVQAERDGERPPLTRRLQLGPAGTELKIRMELYSDLPSERVSMVVTSIPDGAVIPDARVMVLRGDSLNLMVVAEVCTDAQGRAFLPWAKGYRYEVKARGYSPWTVPAPGSENDPLAVQLVRHARLHGRLSHPLLPIGNDGRPPEIMLVQQVPGAARTHCEFVNEWVPGGEVPENVVVGRGQSIQPQAHLDHAGRWEVTCVPMPRDGEIRKEMALVLIQGGYTRTVASRLTVRPGDDLLVHDSFRGATPLTAQCVDASGQPLDLELDVYLRRADGAELSEWESTFGGVRAQIVAGGQLRLSELPEGMWKLIDEMGADGKIEMASFVHTGPGLLKIPILQEPIPPEWRPGVPSRTFSPR